jgi:hypothetical protein
MDRAVHAPTSGQTCVGGVDDGTHVLPGDIALHQLNLTVSEFRFHVNAFAPHGLESGAGWYSFQGSPLITRQYCSSNIDNVTIRFF